MWMVLSFAKIILWQTPHTSHTRIHSFQTTILKLIIVIISLPTYVHSFQFVVDDTNQLMPYQNASRNIPKTSFLNTLCLCDWVNEWVSVRLHSVGYTIGFRFVALIWWLRLHLIFASNSHNMSRLPHKMHMMKVCPFSRMNRLTV